MTVSCCGVWHKGADGVNGVWYNDRESKMVESVDA